MRTIPTVQKYMTYVPHLINYNASIADAIDVMKTQGIRHLPVIKGGKPAGVLSDRDVKGAMAFRGADPTKLIVGDICHDHPFTVSPQSNVSDVATEMVERRIDSALVLDNGHLVGIFTTSDAMKVIVDVCELLNK